MSPDQISIITSLIAILKMLSTWPAMGCIFFIIIGPWLMSIMLAFSNRKRFEAVVTMYEKNVELVEKYEKISCELKDIIIMNTTAQTSLTEVIRTIRQTQ